jgi:hypothetical protein
MAPTWDAIVIGGRPQRAGGGRLPGQGGARVVVLEARSKALAAARRVGWPVALKTAAPGVAHKSGVGGVVFGVDRPDRLAIRPLLHGVRGTPRADLEAVADAVANLSVLALDLGDRLVAVDVNPLVAGPAGCVAVDALVAAGTGEAGGRAPPPVAGRPEQGGRGDFAFSQRSSIGTTRLSARSGRTRGRWRGPR